MENATGVVGEFCCLLFAINLMYNKDKKRSKPRKSQVRIKGTSESLSQHEQLRAVRRILSYRNKKSAA